MHEWRPNKQYLSKLFGRFLSPASLEKSGQHGFHGSVLQFFHASIIPFFSASVLPCFHFSVLPFFYASILPCFPSSMLMFFGASILPCLHFSNFHSSMFSSTSDSTYLVCATTPAGFNQSFYIPPQDSGGVLWFHIGRRSVTGPSVFPYFVSG